LVNTRNKETKWYRQVGATEEAAQTSAAGKVQEKGYIPSFPITYNINGIPTYVMSLKDRAGLVKMIAMVSVQDYSVVGVGNNLQETLRSYKNALNSTGNQNSIRSGSQQEREKSVEGKIVRIASEVNNGNTFYYFTLESMPDKIFIAGASISNELALTQAGDLVKVSFDMNQNRHFDVSGFSNKNFETLPKSESDTVTVSEPQSTGQN
jgi:hypothetical protein